ncbi:unnamed protein product [Leuciscus chuanchicus]
MSGLSWRCRSGLHTCSAPGEVTWDTKHTRNGPFPRVPSSSARLALAPQLSAHSADEEKVWGDEADNEGTILLSRQIVCSGLSEVPASSTKLHAPSASGLGTSARERKSKLSPESLAAHQTLFSNGRAICPPLFPCEGFSWHTGTLYLHRRHSEITLSRQLPKVVGYGL